MFVVSEADAATIRNAFDKNDELSAAIELRARFPLIANNAIARQWALTIAGWKPLPAVLKPAKSREGKRRWLSKMTGCCPVPTKQAIGISGPVDPDEFRLAVRAP